MMMARSHERIYEDRRRNRLVQAQQAPLGHLIDTGSVHFDWMWSGQLELLAFCYEVFETLGVSRLRKGVAFKYSFHAGSQRNSVNTCVKNQKDREKLFFLDALLSHLRFAIDP